MPDDIDEYIRKFKSRKPQKTIKAISADQLELAVGIYGYYVHQDSTRCASLTELALIERADWDDPTIKASIEYAKEWWMEAYGY